jgi:MFS family permease
LGGNWSEAQVDWHYESWTKEFDLICENAAYRPMYRQLIQFMAGLAPIFAAILSDSWGRVKVFKIATVSIFFVVLVGYFVPSITFKAFSLGLFVAEEGILCLMFTTIINESCSTNSNLRSAAIGFYFSIFALGGLV